MSHDMGDRVPANPGDMGRRIAHRREELGLTLGELAARARVDPEYLEYLETRPGHPTAEMLMRVAHALQTTARRLLGEGRNRPPGSGEPGRRPRLEPLDEQECLRLISAGGVGRIAFMTESGPAVLPVNFVLLDDSIVFRTAPGSPQATHAEGDVGFEVDHLDETMSEGWSVLVVGQARTVTEAEELYRIRERGPIGSWAGGDRDLHMRIDPTRITGRRIHADEGQ